MIATITELFFFSDRRDQLTIPRLKARGGSPYSGLYGEAPPERGAFFKLVVY